MDRDHLLQSIRPDLGLEIADDKNEVEVFMHKTLRPILKFQNDLLLAIIRQTPHFTHLKLRLAQQKENRTLLKNFLQNHKGLRHQILGIVTGLFTTEELGSYFNHSSELNKRIMEMTLTRFLSQLE